MKFFKSKYASHLSDMVCALLLGASVCSVLLPSAGLETGYGGCLLLTAADLALIFLFTRKWWILPAFLAFAAGIALLITAMFGVDQYLLEYIGGFILRCVYPYTNVSPNSADALMTAVRLALALPPAAVSYLYFRRLFFFPALPPVATAVLLWTHYSKPDVFIPVLMMLLAAVFFSMAKTTANRINRKLPDSEKISGALLVMTAIVIVPVMLFFSFIASPEKDGDWRSKGFADTVDDFSSYMGLGDGRDPAEGTFDTFSAGLTPLEYRLGGDISPDNTEVMRVTTDTPLLLKGAVFDAYDGSRWYDGRALRGFRLTSFFWQGKRREVFGLGKPDGGVGANELFNRLTRNIDLAITVSKGGRTLFFAGMAQSLESRVIDVSDVFFNGQSEIYTSKPQYLLYYKLNTVVFDRELEGFDDDFNALERMTENAQDNEYEAIKEEYLQLPVSLPAEVFEKAQMLTRGRKTSYEKAKAIESWLRENCTYTLSPGDPPEDSDFVAYFLKTRKGYCVYFASAMTVLARAAGLPARFVTGYALKRNPMSGATNSYVATNATAHAWTEIYFKGIGWLPFDSTGWNSDETAVLSRPESEGRPPVITPPPALPPDAQKNDGLSASDSGAMPDEIKAILISAGLLTASFCSFALIRSMLLLASADVYYGRLCRKHKTNAGRAGACYGRILRQLGFFGVKPEAGDTITSFARRADEFFGNNETALAFGCVIRMRFGLVEPDDSDVKRLCEFSAALEKRLRAKLGFLGYLWRRILTGR